MTGLAQPDPSKKIKDCVVDLTRVLALFPLLPLMPIVLSKAAALLPEIKHIFRTPDPRPPVMISYGFAAGILVPFAIFALTVIFLLLANLPRTFMGMMKFAGFLTCLSAMMLTIVAYWFSKILLFPTLGILGALLIPAMVIGKLYLDDRSKASHQE
ncbi:putative oligosaccharyltransferase complex subunit delta (ribophorin II) [Paratrimastix pyriformis]|uniref:Oligosaccharyltransferase complex subunit delta (Ribophorin II) n=1 Tax=Paratrimastix pyriformis TaxID=342808 RepID=A0ABQ8UCX4_9EUKA|nr:putative oligosaccharyltransferase complex subunit delta (ribophorin II) [Paratrimastix pyriformis]